MDNKSLSHTKWKCQYHIVFIPKYRKKILYGRVRNDVREIISTLCKYKDVDNIVGAVCVDHIHLSVAIPPKISIANFMGYLKGKSTLQIPLHRITDSASNGSVFPVVTEHFSASSDHAFL